VPAAVAALDLPGAYEIHKATKIDAGAVLRLLLRDEGMPVVVKDGQAGWGAKKLWDLGWLAKRYGDDVLKVTDRAPEFSDDDPPARALDTKLRDYAEYAQGKASWLLDEEGAAAANTGGAPSPWAAASWSPFNDHPELNEHWDRPYFVQDSMPAETEEERTFSNAYVERTLCCRYFSVLRCCWAAPLLRPPRLRSRRRATTHSPRLLSGTPRCTSASPAARRACTARPRRCTRG